MPVPPTVAQHNHKFYDRTDGDFEQFLNDAVIRLSSMFGFDEGMTTNERELELLESFGPHNVYVINGVGYGTDGVTTLYDDDGDGAWDTGLQTGVDGTVYEFGPNGWAIF